LARFGLVSDWAKDGREAIERASRERYDLIFMDLQMSELDGIETTYAIRKNYGDAFHPYIAALTANALGESREVCRQAGMRDFVTKPISGDAIREALFRFKRVYEGIGGLD